jgi:hypothetical protein
MSFVICWSNFKKMVMLSVYIPALFSKYAWASFIRIDELAFLSFRQLMG